jgi:hypothetical protein
MDAGSKRNSGNNLKIKKVTSHLSAQNAKSNLNTGIIPSLEISYITNVPQQWIALKA